MANTILITGASSGIGKATAKHFHDKGWNVVATMRSPDKETELGALDNTLVTRLDVTDKASIEAAVAAGLERFGRIDALLNNAGYGAYGVLEATPSENIERQFDTNVLGLIETTKAVIPHFRANRAGVIINVSSMGGKVTFPLGTLYHGTKFAVEGLSEALAYEMSEIGVRVKVVEPGAIKTDFGGRSFDFSNDESMAEYQPLVGKLFAGFEPMSARAAEASVVADVILQAAEDTSSRLRYIAGEDAQQIIELRRTADDETVTGAIKQQLGL
jgi:NAD(P)-dependent dehydrogenase (short-subunit alcohol dehydrogenase family)